jgi:hypothetical protein
MEDLRRGPLAAIFAPWRGFNPNRPDPLTPTEERELSLLSSAWKDPSCTLSHQERETLDQTLKSLKRLFSMLSFNPEISQLSIVMAWLSWVTEEFLKMLHEKLPEALLLVVYYCVALKRVGYMWWVEGKAENLLRTVVSELGERWERWLRWPVEQVLGGGEVVDFSGKRIKIDGLAVADTMAKVQ